MSAIPFLLVCVPDRLAEELTALLRRLYPATEALKASSDEDALRIIREQGPVIALLDMSSPQSTGAEMCATLKNAPSLEAPYCIAVTGRSNEQTGLAALENRADDFLDAALSPDEALARLRAAERIVTLRSTLTLERKKLKNLTQQMKRDLEDYIAISVAFVTSRIPESEESLERITLISMWIAQKFGEFSDTEIERIRIAAKLCLIGKLYLPDELLDKPIAIDGKPSHKLMHQAPLSAEHILKPGQRFASIGKILRHIFENYDGSGFPDRLRLRDIPIESRIIRVTLDFEAYRTLLNMDPLACLQRIAGAAKRVYDPRFVALLDEYIWTVSPEDLAHNVRAVKVYELAPGMVLAREIMTNAGLKLAPAETTLQQRTIDVILSHSAADPIIGSIYIKT